MAIILFAIIGATIKANAWYWIAFGIFCAIKVIQAIIEYFREKERASKWNF